MMDNFSESIDKFQCVKINDVTNRIDFEVKSDELDSLQNDHSNEDIRPNLPSLNDGLSSGSEKNSPEPKISESLQKNSVLVIDTSEPVYQKESIESGVKLSESSPKHSPSLDSEGSAFNKPLKTGDYESDNDTDKLLSKSYEEEKPIDIPELKIETEVQNKMRMGREVAVRHSSDMENPIPGVLFRTNYLGSTQFITPIVNTKSSRMIQAQEALERVKAPEGESQPLCPVELFVSAMRILIMNINLQEIMIDHTLKNISYIADIGDILVVMAKRDDADVKEDGINNRFVKIICHVFKSTETKSIAQCIGRAFHISYTNFLRENGIDESAILEKQRQNELESIDPDEFFCDEINMFCDKTMHKEIYISKVKGEAMGLVIVESGWGSLLPCIVIGNMSPAGPAARSGLLNIGNQILEINGQSTVGLTFTENQNLIKKCKHLTTIKLIIVESTPVTEVMIRRPDIRHQLGFSVQNGVVCSLLRGGIAERGGLRIDHRIIEINGESVVTSSHEIIYQMLAIAIGEIHLRTMPAVIFRLLTGQENPIYI